MLVAKGTKTALDSILTLMIILFLSAVSFSYQDADIYGGSGDNKDDDKKVEENDEIDYLAEANDHSNAASNKRSRDESGADEPMVSDNV